MNKKNEFKKNYHENNRLQHRIIGQKSNYSQDNKSMLVHTKRRKEHLKLLENGSPSTSKIDPLIVEVLKKQEFYNNTE